MPRLSIQSAPGVRCGVMPEQVTFDGDSQVLRRFTTATTDADGAASITFTPGPSYCYVGQSLYRAVLPDRDITWATVEAGAELLANDYVPYARVYTDASELPGDGTASDPIRIADRIIDDIGSKASAAALAAEAQARQDADTGLGDRISGEIRARTAADTTLGNRIDVAEGDANAAGDIARRALAGAVTAQTDAEAAQTTANTATGKANTNAADISRLSDQLDTLESLEAGDVSRLAAQVNTNTSRLASVTERAAGKLTAVDSVARARAAATPEGIRDSLETLTGDDRLDATAIKNLPDGIDYADLHHDGTIAGDFSARSPARVANPFTDADEAKLDRLADVRSIGERLTLDSDGELSADQQITDAQLANIPNEPDARRGAAANTIGRGQLQTGSVTEDKIAPGAVTPLKLGDALRAEIDEVPAIGRRVTALEARPHGLVVVQADGLVGIASQADLDGDYVAFIDGSAFGSISAADNLQILVWDDNADPVQRSLRGVHVVDPWAAQSDWFAVPFNISNAEERGIRLVGSKVRFSAAARSGGGTIGNRLDYQMPIAPGFVPQTGGGGVDQTARNAAAAAQQEADANKAAIGGLTVITGGLTVISEPPWVNNAAVGGLAAYEGNPVSRADANVAALAYASPVTIAADRGYYVRVRTDFVDPGANASVLEQADGKPDGRTRFDGGNLVSIGTVGSYRYYVLNQHIIDAFDAGGTLTFQTATEGFHTLYSDKIAALSLLDALLGLSSSQEQAARQHLGVDRPPVSRLASAANILWNVPERGAYGILTLGTNVTLSLQGAAAAPGAVAVLEALQDSTGGRTLTLHSSIQRGSVAAPVLSTAANATDRLFFQRGSASWAYLGILKGTGR